MVAQLRLGDLCVDVVMKDIKNVHLSVHPPTGRVRIAAPLRMSEEAIRVFAISKHGWIKVQQAKLDAQERETPREFLERESHYLWGQRYLLVIEQRDRPPSVALDHRRLVLSVRPGTRHDAREAVVARWYRDQIKTIAPELIAKWEPILGVCVASFLVRQMKTKWGSCTPSTRSIRLNTDLAKKPRECLEYIVVHEMIHLIEPTHNARFRALMDQFMPQWKFFREELNRAPLSHVDWVY